MASLPHLLLLLLLGIAAAPLKAQEFDYFTLALSWPGTKCLNITHDSEECRCSTNGCCNPQIRSGFTIRGFWPDYNNGTWPSCCNGDATFDENEIIYLMLEMEIFWPSYNCTISSACGSPKESNWAYEWVKHGTCASPVLSTPYDYFSTAQRLFTRLDFTEIMWESGYVASNSAKYSLKGIYFAIKKALGVTPVVLCYGDAVKEVQICYDKTFQLQDCPTTKSGMLSKSSSDKCPSFVTLPIKNEMPWPPEKMNHISFRGVQNW